MTIIPDQYKALEYIGPIEWEEIFSVWKQGEVGQESWQRHWKERGFASWEDWRRNYVAPLFPEKLQWYLFQVSEFSEDFLSLNGVPSRSWIEKCYNGEKIKRLEDIIVHSIVKNNEKIEDIINNFPKETMLTGIVKDGKIILIEGMHRACALAVMLKNKEKINSNLKIALAEFSGEIPVLGKGDNK